MSVMVIGAELTLSVTGAVALDEMVGMVLDCSVVVTVGEELAPVERMTDDVGLARRPPVESTTDWFPAIVDVEKGASSETGVGAGRPKVLFAGR